MVRVRSEAQLEPLVVRPKQAAQLLGIGYTEVYRLINEGAIDSFVDGRKRCIIVKSLHDYVAMRRKTPSERPRATMAAAVAASKVARAQRKRPKRREAASQST